MPRIRHIALVTDDPAKTAEFYKEQFGLTELYRRPGDSGEKGVGSVTATFISRS